MENKIYDTLNTLGPLQYRGIKVLSCPHKSQESLNIFAKIPFQVLSKSISLEELITQHSIILSSEY